MGEEESTGFSRARDEFTTEELEAMRIIRIIATIVLLLDCSIALTQTQQRTFQDSMGRNTGRSVTDRNGTTTVYDARGRQVGIVRGR